MRGGLFAIATLLACSAGTAPSRPQVVVAIDVDAPVPRMIDRARITVLDDLSSPPCDACVREVALGPETPWPISFGVASAGRPRFVRVVLYKSGRVGPRGPEPSTAIDRIGRVRFSSGVDRVRMDLTLGCVGSPSSLDAATSCRNADARSAPIEDLPLDDGRASRVGTFGSEVRRACNGEPRAPGAVHEGERCIEGGVFWMGDVRRSGAGPYVDGVPEHVVVLSGFFLDEHELTVGRYRALVARGLKVSRPPIVFRPGGDDTLRACNMYEGPADAARDARPLNCLTAITAEEICAFDGGRHLPSEAQWEWAAGGRERETLYPWGDETWSCGDMAVSALPPSKPPWTPCPPDASASGGGMVGAHPRDRTPDGVMDLAARLSEWVRDGFEPYGTGCWAPGAYGVDPVCPPSGRARATRGGDYQNIRPAGDAFAVTTRRMGGATVQHPTVGFRCARSGG